MMWWLATAASAHVPVLVFAGPADDWCGMFRDAMGAGDLLLLAPGDYTGPCEITAKPPVAESEYSVLAAQDQAYRPRIHWDGVSDHILRVNGEMLQVAWIDFPDVPVGVDAIQVTGGQTVWLLDNRLSAVAGTGIRATGVVTGLRLTDMDVQGAGGAGVVVEDSRVVGAWVEESLFVGLETGIRIDAAGGLLDGNVVDATTALEVGGGVDATGNLARGAVVAGASTWTANVLVGGLTGGAGAAWYGNTIVGGGAPVSVVAGSAFVGNAVDGPLPADGTGNVACLEPAACWVDPAGLDLFPVASGPLDGAGDAGGDDWCGDARGVPPAAGALEVHVEPSGPLDLAAFKRDIECGDLASEPEEPPADTGTPDDTDAPPVTDPPEDSKGCATSPMGAPWLALLLLRRRRGAERAGRAPVGGGTTTQRQGASIATSPRANGADDVHVT